MCGLSRGRVGSLVMLGAVLAVPVWAAAANAGARAEAAVLLRAYLGHGVLVQVQQAGGELARGLEPSAAAQVQAALDDWTADGRKALRETLDACLQDEARAVFTFFVDRYETAERQGDAAYLAQLTRNLGLDPPPTTYAALRRQVAEQALQDEIRSASALLGNIQTWIDLKQKDPQLLALSAWLDRDRSGAPSPRAGGSLKTLAAAESPLPAFTAEMEPDGSMLESYGAAREERRRRALAEAQAGMQQVAEERRSAEAEVSQRKLAEAQREGEAVRAYAQKLADAEREALDQRQNTWAARLKTITVGVLTGVTGAVTTGVGAGAGAQIAEEVFD